MSAQELNVEVIKTIKKNDYKKLFLKKSLWKKAEGVLILNNYKLEGNKKSFVAIPYKKIKEATDEYKSLKEKKMHPMKRVALCLFTLSKDENSAILEIKKGGMSAADLLADAEMPFSAVGIAIQVTGAGDDAGDFAKEPDPEKEELRPEPQQSTSKEDPVKQAQQIAALMKSISGDVGTVKSTLLNNLKNNQSSEADMQLVEGVLTKIQDLIKLYGAAPMQVQQKLSKEYEAICINVQPQMEKMLEKLEWALAPETQTQDKELGKFLTETRNKLRKYVMEFEDLEKQMRQQPSPKAPAGKELLDMLK